MGFSRNSDGWTIITPSGSWQDGFRDGAPSTSTTMILYVSSSTGKDSGDVGFNASLQGSKLQPYRTLNAAYSRMRSGSPDWMLLKIGDTWTNEPFNANTTNANINKSGKNSDERMVFSSYDATADNNPPIPNPGTVPGRPLIKAGYQMGNNACMGFVSSGSNIAIMGLELYAYTRDPSTSDYVTNLASITVSGAGTGYVPNERITLQGTDGVTVVNPTIVVLSTKVVSATANAGGTGGTPGTQTGTGTTGTGTKFQVSINVDGSGVMTAVNSITVAGSYSANPADLVNAPITGTGVPTGATVTIQMGINTQGVFTNGLNTPGAFTTNPTAFTQLSTSGSGTGATFSNPSIRAIFTTGINVTGGFSNVLTEDCKVSYFGSNIAIQPPNPAAPVTNYESRRDIIHNCWSSSETSVGLGFANIYPATVYQTFLDGNGWNIIKTPGGNPLNHNMYLNANVTGSSAADFTSDTRLTEIIVSGDLFGTQGRSGGQYDNNLWVTGGYPHNFGLSYNGNGVNIIQNSVYTEIGYVWKDGVYTSVTRSSITLTARGPDTHSALWDWSTGIARNNIVLNEGPDPAWHFQGGTGGPVDNLWTFTNNIGWKFSPNLVLRNTPAVPATDLTTTGYNINDFNGDNDQGPPEPFPDPNRSVGTYYDSITGGSGSTSLDFIAACYGQSKATWDTRLTADAVNTYIRAGFGIGVAPPPSGITVQSGVLRT